MRPQNPRSHPTKPPTGLTHAHHNSLQRSKPTAAHHPADRYSIGDRTPELTYAADGSLPLYLQPTEPSDPDRRANWLPTPPGRPFRPILRLYEPQDAVFDGTFTLPPVIAAD
ncbi:DUF1214 domain-containing protein [Streptomyces sp. NPDC015032]|uniref:DUF1214 domain-containing protein n=1 Tax=Streptomyces sp. NPDC015032 TaxID=3364937 RepID=UPI0036F7F036